MISISPSRLDGYQLLHEGSLALADAEENGIHIDEDYCQRKYDHLTRQIKHAEKKLNKHSEIRHWQRTYGAKFNIASNQQLAKILFEHYDYKPEVMTANDKPSVSQEALEVLKIPAVEDLIKMRRLKKARDTYLGNYLKESVDGYLRPFFHLHTVITFRSSSSKINFQNQPVRIEEIKKIVRRAVIPRKGHMICEIDYSGVEVRIAACYHKDPNMIEEIMNPEKDMHRDMAMECFKLSVDQVTSTARYCGKNMFVFPQFYGDYYKSNARDLWSAIKVLNLKTAQGVPMTEHLRKQGIRNYKQFEAHLKKIEGRFWGERFPVYAEWKEKHWSKYQKSGYVDLKTGFRCQGIMSKNDAINYPVQGAAFHCLLWSFIQLNKWMRKNKLRSKIIGQIHDSIVLDLHPSEANRVLRKAKKIMTEDIRVQYPWIIVPLEIETELTPVDGSWYLKKEVKEHLCKCGSEWMYEKKYDDGIIYECPVCGAKEEA